MGRERERLACCRQTCQKKKLTWTERQDRETGERLERVRETDMSTERETVKRLRGRQEGRETDVRAERERETGG